MNTYLDGVEAGGWGYAVTPTAQNGIVQLDPGLSTPYEDGLRGTEIPRFLNGLDNHGIIAGADLERNGTVLQGTADIIRNAG